MLLAISSFLLSALFTSAVLAAPSSRFRTTAARRQSQPGLLEQPAGAISNGSANSFNWAGALWDMDNGTFTFVTGTFTVPAPSGENGSSASIWVGIDGDTCRSAILQTGIDFTLSNGQALYHAWYEWYPAPVYNFTGVDVFAGDIIRLSVTASSTTSGNAMIENLTRGQVAFESLDSTSPLCQQNAEWIVEDFGQSFANFGTVTFTNAVATGNGTYTPSGATIANIQLNNQTLTSVSVDDSFVTIQYV